MHVQISQSSNPPTAPKSIASWGHSRISLPPAYNHHRTPIFSRTCRVVLLRTRSRYNGVPSPSSLASHLCASQLTSAPPPSHVSKKARRSCVHVGRQCRPLLRSGTARPMAKARTRGSRETSCRSRYRCRLSIGTTLCLRVL